ncbi:MAG: ADP-ribosylglycohydrolase family protein [Anaerolineales bacterium]
MSNKQHLALQSLEGLSVGDAFGEQYFRPGAEDLISRRQLPPGKWAWTDDTAMAISILEVLISEEHIDQDELAGHFARRFVADPQRGYGSGSRQLLAEIARGGDWRTEAPRLFDGGSYGNGAAMRAAPIGAYYFDNPELAVSEAKLSAEVTHAHIEGQIGAMAVAAAAAYWSEPHLLHGNDFLRQVLKHLPESQTAARLRQALDVPAAAFDQAVQILGTGQQVAAFDTVPFCLWVVAYHSQDFETALWTTVAGLGDRDTTCAIVGGILGPRHSPPKAWVHHREPLPERHWMTI